jgi:uncharacterized 2Fe-2S/4Fe-4S cluster protein (DUF4445 family)
MPTIVFVNEGKAGTVPEGTTVLQAALDLGVKISHVCGGNGNRSTCGSRSSSDGLSPINPGRGLRWAMASALGCQAKVVGNRAVRALMIPKVELY